MKKILVYLLIALFTINFVIAVTPRQLSGNPTCLDAGYSDSYYKIDFDPLEPGTYDVPGGRVFVWVTAEGIYFNWTSNFGIDAVMCKGGNQGTNVYDYNPVSFGDNDLHCPPNTGGSEPEISHILLCYEEREIPEFTAIGAGIALLGVSVYLWKKRK